MCTELPEIGTKLNGLRGDAMVADGLKREVRYLDGVNKKALTQAAMQSSHLLEWIEWEMQGRNGLKQLR